MNTKRLHLLFAIALTVVATFFQPVLAGPCPTTSKLIFSQENMVVGLKDKQLYMYVDLSKDADSLRCLSEAVITNLVTKAATSAVDKTWTQPKFSKVSNGAVDVITILNKDEYAKADFGSALRHGQIKFSKETGKVLLVGHSLNFQALRESKPQPKKKG